VITASAMPQKMISMMKEEAKNYLAKPLDVIDF
jgi:hypothetical protein